MADTKTTKARAPKPKGEKKSEGQVEATAAVQAVEGEVQELENTEAEAEEQVEATAEVQAVENEVQELENTEAEAENKSDEAAQTVDSAEPAKEEAEHAVSLEDIISDEVNAAGEEIDELNEKLEDAVSEIEEAKPEEMAAVAEKKLDEIDEMEERLRKEVEEEAKRLNKIQRRRSQWFGDFWNGVSSGFDN